MLVVEGRIALHAEVAHSPVEATGYLHPTAPSLCDDGRLHARQVRVAQTDEAALGETEHPAVRMAVAGPPSKDRPADVQLEVVVQRLAELRSEPHAVGLDGEPEPVGHVHETLVLDRAARHLSGESVVHACDVGPRVVRPVGLCLGQGTARGEIAVAEGAQRLPEALLARLVPLVAPEPVVHDERSREQRISSRNSTHLVRIGQMAGGVSRPVVAVVATTTPSPSTALRRGGRDRVPGCSTIGVRVPS